MARRMSGPLTSSRSASQLRCTYPACDLSAQQSIPHLSHIDLLSALVIRPSSRPASASPSVAITATYPAKRTARLRGSRAATKRGSSMACHDMPQPTDLAPPLPAFTTRHLSPPPGRPQRHGRRRSPRRQRAPPTFTLPTLGEQLAGEFTTALIAGRRDPTTTPSPRPRPPAQHITATRSPRRPILPWLRDLADVLAALGVGHRPALTFFTLRRSEWRRHRSAVEYPSGAMDCVLAPVIDALREAGKSDTGLREVPGVLEMGTACVTACAGGERVSLMTWVSSVVALLRGLAPHERAKWKGILRTLGTPAPLGGGIVDESSAAAEVVGLAKLADVALIRTILGSCGAVEGCHTQLFTPFRGAKIRLYGQKLALVPPTAGHHRHPPYLLYRWRNPRFAGGIAGVSVPLVERDDAQ